MNQEPVNIMGVVAFPNPDKDKQAVRFIDSRYNELFRVPDGGNVVLTQFDGSRTVLPCTYIDDYHAKIGRSVYHICQFAELMEQNGAIYEPEHPREGDTLGSYEVYQIGEVGKTKYCFLSYDAAKDHLRAADYRRVYAGVLSPKLSLDELYAKHNRDERPFGQRMRSLSVSDVLVVRRDGKKKAYYVDSIGFREVPEFLKQLNRKKERGEAR